MINANQKANMNVGNAFIEFLHIIKSYVAPIILGGTAEGCKALFCCIVDEKFANLLVRLIACEQLHDKSEECRIILDQKMDCVTFSEDDSIIWFRPLKNGAPFAIGMENQRSASRQLMHVLNQILREMVGVSAYRYTSGTIEFVRWPHGAQDEAYEIFRDEVFKLALEKGICKSIDKAGYLYKIVVNCSQWANRTYEGHHLGLCILYESASTSEIQAVDLQQKMFAVLATGVDSTLLFKGSSFAGHTELKEVFVGNEYSHETYGKIYVPYIMINEELRIIFAPYGFERVAAKCDGVTKAVVLLSSGDILLFDNWQVAFSRRNGQWSMNSYVYFSNVISRYFKIDKTIQRLIYGTCVDVSFEHTGGCLAIIDDYISDHKLCKKVVAFAEEASDEVIPCDDWFCEDDLSSEYSFFSKDKQEKICVLKKIIDGRSFFQLGRKLRQELLGIDGATIIRSDGRILSIGTVIQKSALGPHGGREAAARKLAQYGLAIKISTDGDVECWAANKDSIGDTSIEAPKVYQFAKFKKSH